MEKILEVSNLKIYVNNKELLKDVNLSVSKGEVVAILGGNGTGKSSLVKVIIADDGGRYKEQPGGFARFKNLFKPKNRDCNEENSKPAKITVNKGEYVISFCGKEVKDIQEFRRRISYIKQDDEIFSYNRPIDEVFQSALISNPQIDQKQLKSDVIELFKEFHLKKILYKRIKYLSGGQKRMVSILAGLIRKDSKIYIFDEPINNLDSRHAVLLSNKITELKRQGKAILIITHCKMFPNVTTAYEIKDRHLQKTDYHYQTCFGQAIDELYKDNFSFYE